MGFWSSLGSAISSVCRGVCSALGAVGRFAINALTLPSRIALTAMGTVFSFVGRWLNKPKEETAEELGEKAMLSDKKPDNFDSINDYINHLRNDIQVDKEKMANLSEQEKMERQAIGTSIYVKQIEENFGTRLPIDFFETVGKLKMDSTEMRNYIDSFKKNGINDMGKMSAHLKGTLSAEEAEKVDKAIKDGKREEAQNQGIPKSPEQINSEVLDMQRAVQSIE